MDLFFNRNRSKGIPQNATFSLTQRGQEKLSEFSGDPKSRFLVALETRGSSDINEIADASGLSKGQVERMIPALVRGNYIQYITSSSVE